VDTHDEVGRLQQEVNDLSQKLAGLTQTQYISTNPDPSLLETITDMDKTLIISQAETETEEGREPSNKE